MDSTCVPRSRCSTGWIRPLVVIGLLIVGGCSKNADAPVEPGISQPPAVTIDVVKRMSTLDTLAAMFDKLPGSDPAADRQAALLFIQKRPEFEASGVSDIGNVWARFTDGRLVLFVNNRTPGSGAGMVQAVPGQFLPPRTSRITAPEFLPSTAKARIMNSLGTAFPGSRTSVDSIRKWCVRAGYALATPDDPTIENLKTVSGDGIFYWTAHGGIGVHRDGSKGSTYSLWTSDKVTSENDVKYAKDLDDIYINYMYAVQNTGPGGAKVNEWHYSVDLWFFAHYMKFAPSSLVYIDACGSGGSEVAGFSFSFANTGMYLGWSFPVLDSDGDRAARFFFDRALGVNMSDPKEAPAQRPFPVYDVLADLSKRGWDKSTSAGQVAQLKYLFANQVPSLDLAPTITLASVTPGFGITSMSLSGLFGADPGADGIVTLNGAPIEKRSWADGQIKIAVPPTGGDLRVSVRGVKSNTIQLTQWAGTLDYVLHGQQTLTQHVVANVAFFADVHPYRNAIAQPPVHAGPRSIHLLPTLTTINYTCSGEHYNTQGVLDETWSGQGSIPLAVTGTEPVQFNMIGYIDSSSSSLSMFVPTLFANYTVWRKETGTSQQPMSFADFGLLNFAIAPGFVITHGSKTVAIGSNTATISWNDMVPKYPPDPSGGQ